MSPLDTSAPVSSAATGCCPAGASMMGEAFEAPNLAPLSIPNADPSAFVATTQDDGFQLALLVENLTCPGCIPSIEKTLNALPGGINARVSLSTGRLVIQWQDPNVSSLDLVTTLGQLGYRVKPFRAETLEQLQSDHAKALLRAMGVAGFAWANVMLLSVSVWAGAVSDMDAATRDLFHWISALIALPAVAYAGQPFFTPAYQALIARRMNMDVPISLAVLLAVIVSVWQTSIGGPHAYFDAALMLLFFLLVGRFLDYRCRSKASTAAHNLIALQADSATVVNTDGSTRSLAVDDVEPGMTLRVLPGDRIVADGVVAKGRSDLDVSVINGESRPETVAVNSRVYAGSMALTGTLDVTVRNAVSDSFLGHVVELMENAEQNRSRFVRLADRITGFYAPAVHVAAAATFLGWWAIGIGWDTALLNAIAVLIITCPCALGLAVPAVQIVSAGRLLKAGALLKSGDALERLSTIDTIVFDKTGTLTEGAPALVNRSDISDADLTLAASLATSSRHPLAKALTRHATADRAPIDVTEKAGCGLMAQTTDGEIRLGNREWCAVPQTTVVGPETTGLSELWLRKPNGACVPFFFQDRIRDDAPEVVRWAKRNTYNVVLLSGDRPDTVSTVAHTVGITDFKAQQSPEDKIRFVEALQSNGHRVLMVGDGLNDAPALTAADVSMSPSTATEVSQTAADIVYLGHKLTTVCDAIAISKTARGRIRENFALALAYNVIALPIAVAGLVTPLLAAVAMSCSSVIVTVNALRGSPRRSQP